VPQAMVRCTPSCSAGCCRAGTLGPRHCPERRPCRPDLGISWNSSAAKDGLTGLTRVLRNSYHARELSASVLILTATRYSRQGRRSLDDAGNRAEPRSTHNALRACHVERRSPATDAEPVTRCIEPVTRCMNTLHSLDLARVHDPASHG